MRPDLVFLWPALGSTQPIGFVLNTAQAHALSQWRSKNGAMFNTATTDRIDRLIEFPPPPVTGTARLVPIISWAEMYREVKATGVEFEEFWHESVSKGVAYFFRWMGVPRGTVLTVFSPTNLVLLNIEVHKVNDVLMSPEESSPVMAEVTKVFRDAGFWPGNGLGDDVRLRIVHPGNLGPH